MHVSPAAEIDSVTPRALHLENSRSVLNEIFNERLLEGIEKANARRGNLESVAADEFCDEEILYTELRKAIFQSFIVSWGLKGYDLDRQLRELLLDKSYSLSLNDSIYRDINYIEGISLNIKELSDVVNIDGHLVGLDKFGHFFAEGWQYFRLVEWEGAGIEQAFAWGKEQERGRYGYLTTGIFSFADLVANFNGFRFWNRILLKKPDPLYDFINRALDSPYVSCEIQVADSIKHFKIIKAWSRNRLFDVSLYTNGAWDEGNNCNSYADPTIEEKVASRIEQVDAQFHCPLRPEHCFEAKKEYGPYAKYMLHPMCMAATAPGD